MPDTTSEPASVGNENVQAIVSRVLSLSIFFVGAGVFAAIGLAMQQTGMLAEYGLTYFSVGAAIGVVGLLLWLVTR